MYCAVTGEVISTNDQHMIPGVVHVLNGNWEKSHLQIGWNERILAIVSNSIPIKHVIFQFFQTA